MNTKSRFPVRMIAQTAVLLALCLTFQLLKGISIYITGPMVNAVLVIAALSCGWQSGLIIACLAPLAAWLIGATPVINFIPAMLPVIMVGNSLIVMFAWLFRNKLLPVGLAIGCVTKAGFLWLTVWYAVLPLFGNNAPEKVRLAAKLNFSYPQLITAVIGSILAFIVWKTLKKYLDARSKPEIVSGEVSE